MEEKSVCCGCHNEDDDELGIYSDAGDDCVSRPLPTTRRKRKQGEGFADDEYDSNSTTALASSSMMTMKKMTTTTAMMLPMDDASDDLQEDQHHSQNNNSNTSKNKMDRENNNYCDGSHDDDRLTCPKRSRLTNDGHYPKSNVRNDDDSDKHEEGQLESYNRKHKVSTSSTTSMKGSSFSTKKSTNKEEEVDDDDENHDDFVALSSTESEITSTFNNENDKVDDDVELETPLKRSSLEDDTDDYIMLMNAADDKVLFDEEKFFAIPTFPETVFNEKIQQQMCSQMEGPIRHMENEGYHVVYLEYMKNSKDDVFRRNSKGSNTENEEEMIRKSLQDAIIKGNPRAYQQTLLQVAKSRNTIVNLGTGAGKTLIAILCIREMSDAFYEEDEEEGDGEIEEAQDNLGNTGSSRRKRRKKKQTLFLVPSVALAIQQSLTLRANLPNFHIETACYARASSRGSLSKLTDCNIIVATHGAIHDLFMHWGDTFSMDKFNLVIIDECHYASGNHTYRLLMEKFYHTLPVGSRPRILGLTASPLINVKETYSDEQLIGMLDNLESTLDATLFAAAWLVSDESSPLLSSIVDEQTFQFRGTNTGRNIPSADNLDLLHSRYREFKQLEYLYKDLGPLIVSIYCSILKRELSRNVFESESKKRFITALEHLSRIIEFCDQEVHTLPNMGRTDKLLALEELVEQLIEEKGMPKTIGLVFVERRITAMALQSYFQWRKEQLPRHNWLSAREARVDNFDFEFFRLSTSEDGERDQFEDSIDDPFHCFQRQQETQHELNRPLQNYLPATNNNVDPRRGHTKTPVNSVALVRNPTQIFNSLSLNQKKFNEAEHDNHSKTWIHRDSNVRDVLAKLRRGDLNLMFATSVVEEGVDVQACSFVVAFDGLSSIKGYIQMKGRARKQDAKFFVFHDSHDDKRSQLHLSVAQVMERRVQRVIEARMGMHAPTIQRLSPYDENNQSQAITIELAAVEAGRYKVGDATVDIQSAKSLLNRYFLSVPLDPFVRSRKETLLGYMPSFESDCLVLPIHLPHEIRKVILPSKYRSLTRRDKQKILSLMACVRLHCYGLLNERLLPLTRKDMQRHIMKIVTTEGAEVETVPLELDGFFHGDCRLFLLYPLTQTNLALSTYEKSLNGKGHRICVLTTDPVIPIQPFTMHHAEFGSVVTTLGQPRVVRCSKEQCEILQQIFVILLNHRWRRRSKNVLYELRKKEEYDSVILPYLIGLISLDGELDWELMNKLGAESSRSKEERSRAVFEASCSEPLPQPRIWTPLYNEYKEYIVFGPSNKSCDAPFPSSNDGVKTYRDYFQKVYSIELANDTPLFKARHFWSLPSALLIQSEKKPASGDGETSDAESILCKSIDLPLTVCVEAPLANAHVALLCVHLPQFLFAFERQQKTEAFIEHCELVIPTLGSCFRKIDFGKVAIAITAKSCNPDENYDKWEWIGDAVLKLLQTDSLLKTQNLKHFIRYLHEGDLTMLRSAMGTNERLKQICTRFRLDYYIMTSALSRGRWTPSPLKQHRNTVFLEEPVGRMKFLADVMESILGLVYLEFGYDICVKVGNELQLTLPWSIDEISVASGESGQIESMELLDVVHLCTGHKDFHRPKLLDEAFTHPSAIDTTVPSYQRLEWIGDAVLCLCVREWLFKHFSEDITLGDLVLTEGAVISNETLGFLSMRYGLQQYLNHRDQTLPKRIESYCWRVREGSGLWGGEPPKPISDVVEAILGAVHVDSDFASGQAATLHLMSPVFRVLVKAADQGGAGIFRKVLKHPIKSLQEMSGELLEIISCHESQFASVYPQGRVLYKDQWKNPRNDESCYVSFVRILGTLIVAVADESLPVSKNKASALVRHALECNAKLILRLGKCRSMVESGIAALKQAEMQIPEMEENN